MASARSGPDLNAPEGDRRIRIGLQADIAGGFPVLRGDAPHDVGVLECRGADLGIGYEVGEVDRVVVVGDCDLILVPAPRN